MGAIGSAFAVECCSAELDPAELWGPSHAKLARAPAAPASAVVQIAACARERPRRNRWRKSSSDGTGSKLSGRSGLKLVIVRPSWSERLKVHKPESATARSTLLRAA